ncbi:MAG: alpha-L-fucosidase [Chthoniobacteraceae bacterium]
MMHDWFVDAKFGIFLHWGIYSAGDTSESWAFFNGEISHEDYMAQASTFTASQYDPQAWAALFEEAGAKYAVLTTKHHDGFALWPTKFNKLNSVEGAPAGRDLVGPYCEALRAHGLKVGLYFSHLDWSHPDYASIMPRRPRAPHHAARHSNPFGYPQGAENPEAWERFLAFHRGQLKELCTEYAPDLLWFDGDWERDADQWRFEELRRQLHTWAPGVILNSRMGGHGDYGTPEQAIPIARPEGAWEFCVTLNDSWGYVKKDRNFKTVRQCVRLLAECVGMGGNLLLDIGPKSDGTLQPGQVDVLKGLGRWMKKHGEGIYGSVAGLPAGHFYGASTLNKARDTLYLFCFDRPYDSIAIKGIRNNILRTSIVGGSDVKHRKAGGAPWAGLPGVLWIDVPEDQLDPDATVIKVELEGPLDLYTGAGDAVTFNH